MYFPRPIACCCVNTNIFTLSILSNLSVIFIIKWWVHWWHRPETICSHLSYQCITHITINILHEIIHEISQNFLTLTTLACGHHEQHRVCDSMSVHLAIMSQFTFLTATCIQQFRMSGLQLRLHRSLLASFIYIIASAFQAMWCL